MRSIRGRVATAVALLLTTALGLVGAAASPAAAVPTTSIPPVTCDGDGVSGKRVQLQYSYRSVNRFAQRANYLRTLASEVSRYFDQSARKTGGNRHVRYVHDSSCRPVIEVFQRTDSADLFAYSKIHHTNPNRIYLQYLEDTPEACGVSFGQWSAVAQWCAEADTAAHELMHQLGAVQWSQGTSGNDHPPHGTPNSHCWDAVDMMCYDDGSGIAMQMVCPTHWGLFDCNNDDYYHTNPPAGSFLADPNHRNAARSDYLIKTGSAEEGGPVVGQAWQITNVGANAALQRNQITPQDGSTANVPTRLLPHGDYVEGTQGWVLQRGESWNWRFVNRVSGRCLALSGTAAGSAVVQTTCNSTSSLQRFTLSHLGLGRYTIQHPSSGLYVTPADRRNIANNPVIASYHTGEPAQQWIFTLAAPVS